MRLFKTLFPFGGGAGRCDARPKAQISWSGVPSQPWPQERLASVACGVLAALLFAGSMARATPADTALTAEQAAVARNVEENLMAPCCFGGTIATHHSPLADKLRQEIRSMAAQGANETQILDHYLDTYGERILAQPLARGFNLLAYWMPAVGFLCGTGLLAMWLLRHRRPGGAECSSTDRRSEGSATTRHLEDQLDAELAALDA
jgi:cytochrome c-type biogenesis protein CcmH